eukprot:3475162-Pyramimonas_sp.AAC.1
MAPSPHGSTRGSDANNRATVEKRGSLSGRHARDNARRGGLAYQIRPRAQETNVGCPRAAVTVEAHKSTTA